MAWLWDGTKLIPIDLGLIPKYCLFFPIGSQSRGVVQFCQDNNVDNLEADSATSISGGNYLIQYIGFNNYITITITMMITISIPIMITIPITMMATLKQTVREKGRVMTYCIVLYTFDCIVYI